MMLEQGDEILQIDLERMSEDDVITALAATVFDVQGQDHLAVIEKMAAADGIDALTFIANLLRGWRDLLP